jgi:small subunit ribosomal protein S18
MDMRKKNNSRTDRDGRGDRDHDRDRDRDFMPSRKRSSLDPNDIIDINDVEVLKHFVTEYGKIIPARISGVTAAQQRQIKRGVRRARNMGLLA